jgi:hypothetical protein
VDAIWDWVFGRLAETNSVKICHAIIKLTSAAERILGAAVFAARLPAQVHMALLWSFAEKFASYEILGKVLKILTRNARKFGELDMRPLIDRLLAAIPDSPYRVARLMCRALIAYCGTETGFDPRVPPIVAPFAPDRTLSRHVLAYFCALMRTPLSAKAHAVVLDAVEGISEEVAVLETEPGMIGQLASELLAIVDASSLPAG